MTAKLCHCGKPLHYNDPQKEQQITKLVNELGEFVPVTIFPGRTFLVPRHYIALHGIDQRRLPEQGFQELPKESYRPTVRPG